MDPRDLPHPAAHSPSLHPSLFPLSVWPFYVKLNPTTTATGLLLFASSEIICRRPIVPRRSLSPPSPSYLLLSAIEHRVPLRDPRYPVKWTQTWFSFGTFLFSDATPNDPTFVNLSNLSDLRKNASTKFIFIFSTWEMNDCSCHEESF